MENFKTLFDSETHEGRRQAMQLGVMAYNLGKPKVADDDDIVADGNMKVGTYTIAAQPDVPRNLLITVTQVDADDTKGTLTITGTNYLDEVITEVIVPPNDTTKETDKAFKTVTSIVGAGWVVSGSTNIDQIKIGSHDKIGLPVALATIDDVILCLFDRAVDAATPSVGDPATVEETKIDIAGTFDAVKVLQVLVAAREEG